MIFREKVVESVLCEKNYVRLLREILLLQYASENLKWKAFGEEHNIDDDVVALK